MVKGKHTRGRMRLTKDTSGQMSIDFLAGVAIFILAFIFIFTFIPGMFTPFQSNSDELTMTADRVSTALVDNVLLVSTSIDTNYDRPNVIDAQILTTTDFTTEAGRAKLGLSGDRIYNIHVTLTLVNHAGPDTVDLGQNYPTDTTLNTGMSGGALNVGQSKRIVIAANHYSYTYNDPVTGLPITVDIPRGAICILTVTVW